MREEGSAHPPVSPETATGAMRRHPPAVWANLVMCAAILVLPVAAVSGCRGAARPVSSRGPISLPRTLAIGRAFSPGIVYIGGDGNLWSMSTRDGSRKRLLPRLANSRGGTKVVRFEVAPGAKRLAILLAKSDARGLVRDTGTATMVVAAFGAGEAWRITVSSSLADSLHDLQWSSDGQRLAYVSIRKKEKKQVYDLMVFDWNARRPQRLYSTPAVPLDIGEAIDHYFWQGSRELLVDGLKAVSVPGRGTGYKESWRLVGLSRNVRPARAGTTLDTAKYGRQAARLLQSRVHKTYRDIGGAEFAHAAWSPDRRWLAFLGARSVFRKTPVGMEEDNKSELWVINSATEQAAVLEKGSWQSRVDSLTWSRDGAAIFYWREVPRMTKSKRLLRRKLEEAVRKKDFRAAGRASAARRNLSFAESADWFYLVSVRPDGTGRKVWFRQLGDWSYSQYLHGM